MASDGVSPHYQHTRLSDARNQIRLLRSVPSAYDDGALCFKLETFDFGSAPPYRALSYTWGAGARPGSILLNSKPFLVRRNLLDFL